MSATNATTNYELPVFIATDKPAWLVDWNGAMNTIDSAIKEAKTAGDNAQSTANTNANNIQTLDGTVASQGTAIGNLQTAVSGNTGSINTINSLIGNGEPTTTDKTIIGAINEINAKVGDVSADDVSFDPTGTSLQSTNVEDAIKEVASGAVTPEADDVVYDNTSSGLTATNVQDAIDEIASGGAGGADLNFVTSGSFTVASSAGTVDTATDARVLLNTAKSIGKIYGFISVSGSLATVANQWSTIATLTNVNMPTVSEAYDIIIGASIINTGAGFGYLETRLHFNTDGTVDVQVYATAVFNYVAIAVSLAPCIYILKDLGD